MLSVIRDWGGCCVNTLVDKWFVKIGNFQKSKVVYKCISLLSPPP